MLRIATANINGIRAAHRRGFGGWLAERDADVIALQEIRAQQDKLPDGAFGDHHVALDLGTLPGRNGVAVLTRHPPAAVRTWSGTALVGGPALAPGPTTRGAVAPDQVPLSRGLGRFAAEGRYLEVDLVDVPLTIACLYLPKGGLPAHLQRAERMREAPDGGARYARKMGFMAAFSRYLTRTRRAAAAAGREFLLMGDLNIAHTRQDVAAWRRNQNNDGFLPEEREWLGQQLSPRTLVDVVRHLHPDRDGPYSWWSWLGQSFANDAGWRLDYHLATPRLARTALRVAVDREHHGTRLSDHSPVVVDYDWR
ncbi:exodeoxyribonuclease III [Brachybacterium vulturis]|uniref:Exodeoxyribonuclease III n=1 Tax=Brachybacterium vulturis TaxID=2017484 RepID=A0A291GKS2_9MICO|nr:exodeoxyribonuclease III [Brachybacterium vulturis]ATG50636.1 exodeoxyribonuclease III [Brachybacterium vulturis]